MSAPRLYETDPFHLLDSNLVIKQFLYICKSASVISSIWYEQVCLGIVCISQPHMRSCRILASRFRVIIKKDFFLSCDTCYSEKGGFSFTNREVKIR